VILVIGNIWFTGTTHIISAVAEVLFYHMTEKQETDRRSHLSQHSVWIQCYRYRYMIQVDCIHHTLHDFDNGLRSVHCTRQCLHNTDVLRSLTPQFMHHINREAFHVSYRFTSLTFNRLISKLQVYR